RNDVMPLLSAGSKKVGAMVKWIAQVILPFGCAGLSVTCRPQTSQRIRLTMHSKRHGIDRVADMLYPPLWSKKSLSKCTARRQSGCPSSLEVVRHGCGVVASIETTRRCEHGPWASTPYARRRKETSQQQMPSLITKRICVVNNLLCTHKF